MLALTSPTIAVTSAAVEQRDDALAFEQWMCGADACCETLHASGPPLTFSVSIRLRKRSRSSSSPASGWASVAALTLGAALTLLLDDVSCSVSSRGCMPLERVLLPFMGEAKRAWPLARGVESVSIGSSSPRRVAESADPSRCGGEVGAGAAGGVEGAGGLSSWACEDGAEEGMVVGSVEVDVNWVSVWVT